MVRISCTRWCLAIVVFGALGGALRAQECPHFPPVLIDDPAIPQDVCLPADVDPNTHPELQLPYFDNYSWRLFLSMVWPARAGMRGLPDATQRPSGQGPVVFQTLKALWEVMRPKPDSPNHACCTAPAASWNDYEDKGSNACNREARFGDLILSSFSKYSDLAEAAFGTLTGPLEARNKTYVRYVTFFNRAEFEQIVDQKLWNKDNLSNDVSFSPGALDVKSAWIDMEGIPHPERYYTVLATVRGQSPPNSCSVRRMGLVGIHIVQKTPRKGWIWSSFEQVDNVPPDELGPTGTMKPYTFYDDAWPKPPEGAPHLSIPCQAENPVPAPRDQPWPIVRSAVHPIHPSTQATNLAFRSALERKGSVWRYYQLVMTQFKFSGELTFPLKDTTAAKSAFANVTMETFDQDGPSATTCISCHETGIGRFADSVFSLVDRSGKELGPPPVHGCPPSLIDVMGKF